MALAPQPFGAAAAPPAPAAIAAFTDACAAYKTKHRSNPGRAVRHAVFIRPTGRAAAAMSRNARAGAAVAAAAGVTAAVMVLASASTPAAARTMRPWSARPPDLTNE